MAAHPPSLPLGSERSSPVSTRAVAPHPSRDLPVFSITQAHRDAGGLVGYLADQLARLRSRSRLQRLSFIKFYAIGKPHPCSRESGEDSRAPRFDGAVVASEHRQLGLCVHAIGVDPHDIHVSPGRSGLAALKGRASYYTKGHR